MAQLMPLPLTISCSSKSRLVLPFWCQLNQVVLDKIQEGHKTAVCVCVRECVRECVRACMCVIQNKLCTLHKGHMFIFVTYIIKLTQYHSYFAFQISCCMSPKFCIFLSQHFKIWAIVPIAIPWVHELVECHLKCIRKSAV